MEKLCSDFRMVSLRSEFGISLYQTSSSTIFICREIRRQYAVFSDNKEWRKKSLRWLPPHFTVSQFVKRKVQEMFCILFLRSTTRLLLIHLWSNASLNVCVGVWHGHQLWDAYICELHFLSFSPASSFQRMESFCINKRRRNEWEKEFGYDTHTHNVNFSSISTPNHVCFITKSL